MGNLIPFDYGFQKMRVIKDDTDEPWWLAKDVCEILDLDVSQIRRLDADEKGLREIQTLGGPQQMAVINESGLYTLIIRSNKPDAKRFRKWITSEVLPAIRKTGNYRVGNLSELDLIIRSAKIMKQIESKQIEHDQRLSSLEAKSHQNSGHTGYWTITAWCKLNNFKLSFDEAMQKGREATRLSKEWEAEVGKIRDERFGLVNSYREDVLDEVFTSNRKCA